MNLLRFFPLSFNRYLVLGIVLFFLGLFLTPFIIGIPIMTAGWFLMTFGFFYSLVTFFPGGKKLVDRAGAGLKSYFRLWAKFFREVWKE